MVELVTTTTGHQNSWAHRFVGQGGTVLQKVKTFHSLFVYYPVMNIMSVHHCSFISDNIDAMNVFIILL